MAERFKAPVLKTDVGVSSPRVRISLPPPTGPPPVADSLPGACSPRLEPRCPMQPTENLNIEAFETLPTPEEVHARLPLT